MSFSAAASLASFTKLKHIYLCCSCPPTEWNLTFHYSGGHLKPRSWSKTIPKFWFWKGNSSTSGSIESFLQVTERWEVVKKSSFLVYSVHEKWESILRGWRFTGQSGWSLYFNDFYFSLLYESGGKYVKADYPSYRNCCDLNYYVFILNTKACSMPPSSWSPPSWLIIPAALWSRVIAWFHASCLLCPPGQRGALSVVQRITFIPLP